MAGSRWPHRRLAVGAFLVVALIMPLPGGEAQVADQLFVPDEDTTFGWTFPDDHVARGTMVDDPADMTGGVLLGAPLPVPFARAVEITALHIDEIDPSLLKLRLEVEELDAQAMQRERTIRGIYYEFQFEAAGYRYDVYGELTTSCTAPEDATCENLGAAGLYYSPGLGRYDLDNHTGSSLGRAPARVLADENAIEVLIPRHLMLVDGGGHPPAGTLVHNAFASSWTSHAIYDSWNDEVGDRFTEQIQPLFRLTQGSYGSQVVLSASPMHGMEMEFGFSYGEPIEARTAHLDVSDQFPARAPLFVTNVLDRKVIVVPEARIISGGDGYQVRTAEAIEIRAGEMRIIELVINGSAPIAAENPLVLEVEISPLGVPNAIGDRLDIEIRSVPRLSPDAPRLYLQATETQDFALSPFGGFYQGLLSPLTTDPDGPADEVPLVANCACDSTWIWFGTRHLAHPALLDFERDGALRLEMDAPTAGDYGVQATVMYMGSPIGTGAIDQSLPAGESTVEVPMLFDAESPRLEPGGFFELDIQARFTALPVATFTPTLDSDAPRVKLKGASYLEFPLKEVAAAVTTADHLVVGLGRGYDDYQYVNPGRTTLWNVTVLNQGTDNDTVTVGATPDDADWKIRIAPGTTYKVGPGESITVGVLATAPEDAETDSHVIVNITATSKLSKGKGSTLTARAIVTSGVQIDDMVFTADNETASRVADKETADAPGPGLIVPVLAALGLAAIHRTRPQRGYPNGSAVPRWKYQNR